jgi:hypothetical protein
MSQEQREALAGMLLGLSLANSALRWSAGRGDCAAMRAALAEGADVEFKERVRKAPL